MHWRRPYNGGSTTAYSLDDGDAGLVLDSLEDPVDAAARTVVSLLLPAVRSWPWTELLLWPSPPASSTRPRASASSTAAGSGRAEVERDGAARDGHDTPLPPPHSKLATRKRERGRTTRSGDLSLSEARPSRSTAAAKPALPPPDLPTPPPSRPGGMAKHACRRQRRKMEMERSAYVRAAPVLDKEEIRKRKVPASSEVAPAGFRRQPALTSTTPPSALSQIMGKHKIIVQSDED